MPDRRQVSFAVDSLLYQTRYGVEDLPRVLDAALASGAKAVKLKLLLSETPLDRLFAVYARGEHRPKLEQSLEVDGQWSGILHDRYGRRHAEIVEGSFAAIRHQRNPLVWILVTDATSDFVKRPLRQLLRSLYPHPVAPIYRTNQIKELFELVGAHGGIRAVRVKQLGHRARICSTGAKQTIERDLTWTDLSVAEAFDEALDSGHWVTDARLEYVLESGTSPTLSINRYGVFTLRGRASSAITSVLDRAVTMAVRWYEFLRNRQRDAESNYRSKPFTVSYNYPVAESRDQISLLRKALTGISGVSCTVLHGNPYFHASMTDFRDGSTYEVVVLNASTITVLPQGRSTVRALQRLCSQLFSEFREGELREASGVVQ